MWFTLLAIALAIVAAGGWYFRRRVLGALEVFGVSRRARRIVGVSIPWLLYGYPALVFITILISIAMGSESLASSPTGIGEWLLVYPFWLSVLIMLQAVPWLVAIDVAALVARARVDRTRLRRLRAIGVVTAVGVFAVYTPARILIGHGALDVNHYEVRATAAATAAGGARSPLRIAFVADLQQDTHTDEARAAEVVAAINDARPDVVLAGGDWINTGPDHIDAAARTAGQLRSRLGTFSVRGDHEHFAYRDRDRSVAEVTGALERNGVSMMHNDVRFIEHEGRRIAVIYLSYNYIFRTPQPEIDAMLERASAADYKILVTHQLDEALGELVRDRVDLALIAHTHGGQVNPVVGLVHVPIARVETPYIYGRYQLGDTTLIVTAGIGFSIAPFRYASPASIEIIDLYP